MIRVWRSREEDVAFLDEAASEPLSLPPVDEDGLGFDPWKPYHLKFWGGRPGYAVESVETLDELYQVLERGLQAGWTDVCIVGNPAQTEAR